MANRPGSKVVRSLPGKPLPSGFDYRPSSEFSQLDVSEEALKEVTEVLESVDESRLSAAEGSHQTYVG
jgi:hypothetical protein